MRTPTRVFLLSIAAHAATIGAQTLLSPREVLRLSAAPSGADSQVGSTVRVGGRVTLGSGIIDTSGISIYIQDASGAGLHIRGRKIPGHAPFVVGDSVVAVGTLTAGTAGLEITNATPALVPVARQSPPVLALALYGHELAAANLRLVRISGTVSMASVGRGDHLLKLVNRIPGADSSRVYVVEPQESADPTGLERFGPDDMIRATGVLVQHPGSADSPPTYYLVPRSAADVTSIGVSIASQRRLTIAGTAAIALLCFLAVAFRIRRAVWIASERAEAALRESEARYRLLVEEAPVGILVHRRGEVLFVNSAFANLLGQHETRPLIGRRLVDLVHGDDRARVAFWIRDLRKRRDRAVRTRESLRRLDGAAIEIEVAATPTVFRGEHAVQVVVQDVTAQAALEDQLRHSQKMEAIGQLAAGVAHDFNNILTAIAGYTQLILDDYTLNEALQKDVEEIQRAGDRASGLTKQLLAVSRRQLVLAEVVDLNEVIASAEQLFQRTIGAEIALDVSLSETSCPVFADRGQLEQVVMNLVLNARDAMPHGGVLQVETRFTRIDTTATTQVLGPGEYVTLVVRDSGIGMSPDTLRRIFDPFFTTKPIGDGTGLGLATMYGIVTGAQGHVSATSRLGAGSEFTVLLPRVHSTPGIRRETPTSVAVRGAGARILLIEDEAAVRTATRRILERSGYEVQEAKNGTDALMLWQESGARFDCVVSDVVLPGLRGPEVIEKFRFDRRDIPVLFVSGYTDRTLARVDVEVPNTAFLQKPFEPKQLSAALSELLRQSAIAA